MAAPLSINSFMKCVVKLQHKYIIILLYKEIGLRSRNPVIIVSLGGVNQWFVKRRINILLAKGNIYLITVFMI